jgi:hypothetical protein
MEKASLAPRDVTTLANVATLRRAIPLCDSTLTLCAVRVVMVLAMVALQTVCWQPATFGG